jgi:hypothetical protein
VDPGEMVADFRDRWDLVQSLNRHDRELLDAVPAQWDNPSFEL